ncbi:hypothetical protein PQX77_005773 [Marasmius sp. AFHP31]|nr:hypothetical protein PQX77_005773 [Marasmius sp. AFHP31]
MQKLSIEYQREAILWRQMKHPNLLPLLGIYQLEDTGELCFISPWMEKGNLVEYMKVTKREDIDHHTLVQDIASGLSYLHSKKIVHGDLKGVNVLITRLLRACIADFGLSRIADTHGIGVTSSTRSAGTMRWLAPELLSGYERPSKSSDMYSFACVCHEIFTGLPPFAELTNDMAVMLAVHQGGCPSRPQGVLELSDAMWALMTECWDKTPVARPTADQVLEKVREMTPGASELLATDWSDSLLTHVRENVGYRSFSSEDPDGSQRRANHGFVRGEFPGEIYVSQYLPQFKKEGADWFALINPSVKEGSDVRLAHTLEHDSAVYCVRFSADGKYVATGCNRTTQIYDVNTGVKICLLVDEAARDVSDLCIIGVCFSPDGKYLATGARDKLIRIWDIEEKQIRTIFRGHSEGVCSVDFSPDGRLLASGSRDKTVRVWDTIDGLSNTFTVPVTYNVIAGVISVKFSSDGRHVAASCMDSCVRIWEVATGQLVGRFRGHQDSVWNLAFTPDSSGLVSGSLDKTLKHWDVSNRNRLNESPCTINYVGHKDRVVCVAVSQDGKYIASGSADCEVRIWDLRNATTQCLLQGHKNSVQEVDFSPSGGILATASKDWTARIWHYKLD